MLNGNGGADILIGGDGKNTLNGGTGADRFVFLSTADSEAGALRDVIAGFTSGLDKIDLSALAPLLVFAVPRRLQARRQRCASRPQG